MKIIIHNKSGVNYNGKAQYSNTAHWSKHVHSINLFFAYNLTRKCVLVIHNIIPWIGPFFQIALHTKKKWEWVKLISILRRR